MAEATAAGDRATEGEARRLLGSLYHAEGVLDLARAELGQSLDILREVERPDLLAQALRSRGFIELFGGSLVDAEWFFGEADAIFRELGDRRGMAWVEQHRAWIGFMSGDFEAAHERLERRRQRSRSSATATASAGCSGCSRSSSSSCATSTSPRSSRVKVAVEAEERGDDWAAAMMQTLQANLRLWQGQLEDAARLAELARKRFRKIEDRYGLSQAMAPLLRAQTALGRGPAAQRTEEELLALADLAPIGPNPLMAVAGAAMHRGDAATASANATRAIAEMRGAGTEAYEPLVVLSLALAQSGRLDESVAALESLPDPQWDHPFAHAVGLDRPRPRARAGARAGARRRGHRRARHELVPGPGDGPSRRRRRPPPARRPRCRDGERRGGDRDRGEGRRRRRHRAGDALRRAAQRCPPPRRRRADAAR